MDTQNVVDTVIEQFEDLVDFDSQGMIDYYVDESWDQLRQNERRQGGFRERHRREWGDALDLLGRIHFLSMEVGRRFNGKCRDNEANGPTPELFDALTRLHGRMCLVSSEIKTLLESGHASGAQARWRTLYETLAIMLFIAQDGNETAERYLLHELITSAEAVDEYSKYREKLGLEPLEEKARKELKGMCARIFGPVDRLISAKTQQRFEVLIREYRESARDVLGAEFARSRSASAPDCNI